MELLTCRISSDSAPLQSRGDHLRFLRIHPKTWLEEPMLAKMRREPALEDLLNDPIVRLVMKADDVTEADLRVLVAALRARLNRSDERQAA